MTFLLSGNILIECKNRYFFSDNDRLSVNCCICSGSDFKLKSFEPLFDQRLLPPSFPKSIKLKSRREAYDFFRNLCFNIKIICKFNAQCDFNEYLVSFFANFQEFL